MSDGEPDTFFIGGMDAGIESLLLSAGGVWLVPADPPEAPGPWIGLAYGTARRRDAAVALRVCLDHGWPVVEPRANGSKVTVWVQGVVADRLLARLVRTEAAPDVLVACATDYTAEQIRGLREALPVGAALSIVDRAGLTNRP